MFVSLVIVLLYGIGFIASDTLQSNNLSVPFYVAILAGVTAALSFVGRQWIAKEYIVPVAIAVYGLLATTTGLLVIDTGFTTSPFIALWMLIGLFAGLFGLYVLSIVAVVINGYLLADLVFLHTINNTEQFIIFLLAYELPLVASFFLWRKKNREESSEEKTYTALAQELSQVANKSEIVINAIDEGVIAVDGQGVIQLINPAAQGTIGWGKQDALKLDYRSVLKLKDKNGKSLEPSQDVVQKTLATNEPSASNDLTLETNSGKRLLVSVHVSPVGQIGSGCIIVFRDITEEKKEEREQAEFISTASHEMRTPIAAIEGYLGLALNPHTAVIDDKARGYIGKAQESVQHLGRLFQDLLDVSRLEDGRLTNHPKVIDVGAFAQDVTNGFMISAKDKNLALIYKPGISNGKEKQLAPVFYAEVDADHMREVLSNLIENAIKYTQEGSITVDLTGDNEHVKVSVKDSGIGIPPEDVSHLFQKFYRIDNSSTREIGGTGLGLYLCRRLVEVMGGRIWVESDYGKGSTFFVEIPRLDHQTAVDRIEREKEQGPQITTMHDTPPPTV
ncbi:PAS domain S-box protein [Candidatus Saccharibacteria bacterium]|nr:PAS domain S-box protein [Candidatus Saccharibacteria bacterium]